MTILIMVYGAFGVDVQATADSLLEAHAVAKRASEENPSLEYCVELDPGSGDNPLYVAGVDVRNSQIGG